MPLLHDAGVRHELLGAPCVRLRSVAPGVEATPSLNTPSQERVAPVSRPWTIRSLVQQSIALVCGVNTGGLVQIVPCLTKRTRQTLEDTHGLPKQCCSPYCVHYWCGASALYQEAVFVKHTLKKDFECCTYKTCCKTSCCCCCGHNPAPGDFKNGDGYEVVSTQPGVNAV